MTDELKHLIAELDATFFRYAHITGECKQDAIERIEAT
jgi:hypothetical protein